MMAYDRTIKVYQADGTTLETTYYSGGVIDWSAIRAGACVDARFYLAAYGGTLDGQILISGNARDGLRIPGGSVIKMFYATGDGTPVYTGVVQPRVRWIERQGHEYQLRGLWRELEKVDINARLIKTSTTIAQIVTDLYTDHISGLSLITGSSITANAVSVTEFILEENADIYRLLEQLAMMASADGQYWVAGVDQAGDFYFQPISTTAGNVQSTFTIGTDATKGEEQDAKFSGSNRIKVRGNHTSLKFKTNQSFTDAASIAANGRTPWRKIPAAALRYNADLVLFKNGYFNLFADPQSFYDRVARVHTDGDTVPTPWSGRGIVDDTQRGVQQTDYIKTLEVVFNERLDINADVGRVSRTKATSLEPNAISDFHQDITNNDADDEILPETDEDNPPYSGAPGGVADGGGNPGFTAGGGLDAGAIQEVNARPRLRQGENMTWEIMINLAGNASGTGTVLVDYIMYNDDEVGVAAIAASTIKGTVMLTDGDYDTVQCTWSSVPVQSGWIHARVKSAKIGSSGDYYFPDNLTYELVTRVADVGAAGSTLNFNIATGWLYNGQ